MWTWIMVKVFILIVFTLIKLGRRSRRSVGFAVSGSRGTNSWRRWNFRQEKQALWVWWTLLQGAKPSATMCFHFKDHITEWATSWKKSKAVLNCWNTSAWLPNTNLFSGTDSFCLFVCLIDWFALVAACGIFVASWGIFRCSNRIL